MSACVMETPGIWQQTEIDVRVPNELAHLARLFETLTGLQRCIRACCFYSNHEHALVLILTANEQPTARLLRAAGFGCETYPVIALARNHRCVSSSQLSGELRAAGINVLNAYTCRSPHDGGWLVLRTTDNARAAGMLAAMDQLGAPATHGPRVREPGPDQSEPRNN